MGTSRNYQHEAAIENPKRKQERAARNRSRLKVQKAGLLVNGKQINHKDGNPLNTSPANLEVMTAKKNNTGRKGGSPRKKGA